MKRLILFALLFSALAVPVLGELTDADLNKIRLIVKEEIAPVERELKAEIAKSEKNMRTYIDTKFEGVHKQITLLTNFVYVLIALIVAAIAIPQVILTWRSGRDSQQQRINQELREEIEALKRQQIVRP